MTPKFVERAVGDLHAALDHEHMAADFLEQVEQVRGNDDGDAVSGLLSDEILGLANGDGVEPREGFVEKHGPRPMEETAGQRRFLLHAAGKLMREPVGGVGHFELREQFPRAGFSVGDLVNAGGELEVLAHAEILEKAGFVGKEGDLAFGRHGGSLEVVTGDAHLPQSGRNDAGDAAERGGLARAVRADEAEDIALPDAKRQIGNGGKFVVMFGEAGDFNHAVRERVAPKLSACGAKWRACKMARRSLTKRPGQSCNAVMKSLLILLAAPLGLIAGEPQFTDVFDAGPDGYASIRIPSVVVTHDGTALAFAEGRQADADQAENEIILKRSADGGVTWSAAKVVASDRPNSLNNPTALAADGGRIFLMYQRIPAHLKERSAEIATGFEGDKIYRNFLVASDDDGKTWSAPREVTRGTKHETGATTVASGPGLGIQLTRGEHKGRLIIPFNEGPYRQWNVYAAFSDDGGVTWQCGANAPGAFVADSKSGQRSQVNEVQMVELSDGSVRLNSRQFAGAKVRKTAVSRDGGATWGPIEDAPPLRDPSCMGSIFRYSFDDAEGRGRIVYSGPDSNRRENGTIRLSFDDGATWPVGRVLRPTSFGYSVLTRFSNGDVGCLFEAEGRIIFARFPLSIVED